MDKAPQKLFAYIVVILLSLYPYNVRSDNPKIIKYFSTKNVYVLYNFFDYSVQFSFIKTITKTNVYYGLVVRYTHNPYYVTYVKRNDNLYLTLKSKEIITLKCTMDINPPFPSSALVATYGVSQEQVNKMLKDRPIYARISLNSNRKFIHGSLNQYGTSKFHNITRLISRAK